MCGITGILAFTEEGKKYLDKIDDAVKSLRHRGPDGSGVFRHGNVALGHTRLAIIDTSDAAAQPFTSSDGRFTIVFNGEIFNYKELRAELEKEGYSFRSNSDTEVLLTMYAKEGSKCLDKLNGFFAFAVYDTLFGSLYLVRDRYGEKPLYCATGIDEDIRQLTRPPMPENILEITQPDFIAFASEPKALYEFGFRVALNEDVLKTYLHLNYNPTSETFNYNFGQVAPGDHAYYGALGLTVRDVSIGPWYNILSKRNFKGLAPDYGSAKAKVFANLELAVQRRLISDVPVGTFLSGGIDSSIVTAIAARQNANLETFSIGYADEKYFDETYYAKIVSRHVGSKHHIFNVTNADLLESLHSYLDNLDEPFADSSALAVNLLCRETRKYVTVALSGDGADELFAGYNKHAAEYIARNQGTLHTFLRATKGLWNILPASRQSKIGNTIRQLRKFSEGMEMNEQLRYLLWAGYSNGEEADRLLLNQRAIIMDDEFVEHFDELHPDFNDVLIADIRMVLQGDMLVKADRMSMLNGLEVRSPFLDHELVEYVMSLPSEYKITRHERKKILKDAFRDMLPPEIFSRRKQGFEVPLLKWFRGDLRGMIDELLDEKFLKEQNLFNPAEVQNIRKQLHSNDPGDSAARIWGLIVFQSWWKKYMR